MVVSATISSSPTMIYFGQEVGEAGNEDAGFGKRSRTSIFDYVGVPAHQGWLNGGKYDGGGLTAAQLPDDAQFNSMPATAIASGQIDLVATAAALPDKILMQLQHSQVTLPPQKALQDVAPSATPLQRIISRLQQQTRHLALPPG